MAKLAYRGSKAQEIRNAAVRITTAGFNTGNGLQQKDFEGEAHRLLAFVRDDIRYVGDPEGTEMLHDPVTLLDVGAGDCDDKAILLAALLLSIGHKPRFVGIAFQPEQWCHVWVQDFMPPSPAHPQGRWIDLEATEPIPSGQAVPHAGAAKLYQDAF